MSAADTATIRAWIAQARKCVPHESNYERAGHSLSGKLQGRCTVCGRITAGFEKRCWTLEMAAKLGNIAASLLDCAEALALHEEHYGDPLKVIRPALARLMEVR